MDVADLKAKIRDIKNFPTEGILFKDITTLLKDGPAFRYVVDTFVHRYRPERIDVVVAVESRGFAVGGALVLVGAWAPGAVADEAKSPISAAMLLNILAPPAESRDAAFDRAMKEPGPPPLAAEDQIQPDGSVRYGSLSITVKNPCPPGTLHYETPPRPGRARK